jgi:hypothetical protein
VAALPWITVAVPPMTDREMLAVGSRLPARPGSGLVRGGSAGGPVIGRLIDGRTLLDRHLFPEVSSSGEENSATGNRLPPAN